MKKLYKSDDNKVFTGLLGGLGEHLNLDPVVVRLVFILVTLVTGFFPFGLLYLLAIFLVPEKPMLGEGRIIDVD